MPRLIEIDKLLRERYEKRNACESGLANISSTYAGGFAGEISALG